MKPYVDRGGIEREREEQAEQLLQAVCRAHQEGRLQAVIQELEQEREHGSSWPDEAILTEDTLRLAQHLRAGLMAETWPLFDAHHPDKIALDPSEKRNACGAAARARGAAYCVWHLKALFVGLLLECQAVENKWLAARNQGASENDAPTVCGMFVDGKASVVW